jgi:hypothetical protein
MDARTLRAVNQCVARRGMLVIGGKMGASGGRAVGRTILRQSNATSFPSVEFVAIYGNRRALGATLAQSVEQLIRNQQVVGSTPTGGSNNSKQMKDFSEGLHLANRVRIVRKPSAFVKASTFSCFSPHD